MSARSNFLARRGSDPSRGVARPRPGRGLARVAMAFCLLAAANGQNAAGESGTFVDVTPNIQTQLAGRFGTAPSHRSGHTMVRPPAEPPPRASRRPVVPPSRRVVVLVSGDEHRFVSVLRLKKKTDDSFFRSAARRDGVGPTFPDPHALTRTLNETAKPRNRETAKPRGSLPASPRCQTRVDEDTAVVFGGLGLDGELNDVWEFRVAGANWTRLHAGAGAVETSTEADAAAVATANAAPSPRVGHAAVVLRGDLYVFGGYDSSRGHTNDVWAFARADGVWRQLASGAAPGAAPAPRSGASAMAPDPEGGTFVIFGGDGKDDVWAFDVDAEAWTMRQGESVAVTSGGGRARIGAARFAATAAIVMLARAS